MDDAGSPAVMLGRTILVIDDNEAVRTALEVLLSLQGAKVEAAGTPAVGLERHGKRRRRPRHPGHELPSRGHHGRGGRRAVPCAAPREPGRARRPAHRVDAPRDGGRAGASRARPTTSPSPGTTPGCVTTVRNLLQLRAARATTRVNGSGASTTRARDLAARFDLRGIVYASDAMHAVVQMATQVARADVPVLITGPERRRQGSVRRDRAGQLAGARRDPSSR